MSETSRSLFSQRVRLNRTLRMGSHVGIGILLPRDRRRTGWGAVTAVSLLADAVYCRLLESDPKRTHLVRRTVWDSIDGAVFALAGGPDPVSARHPQIVATVGAGVEAGIRLTTGDEAVPVLEPARQFPPRRGSRTRAVAETLGPVVLPHLAIRCVRARRGWGWNRFEYIWPALGVVGGAGLGYYRNRLHAEARRDWTNRAAAQIAVEERTAAVRAALHESQGHHFKKNLLVLGEFGSSAAHAAGREQLVHPARLVSATPGSTLFEVAYGIEVSPMSARDIWVDSAQRDILEQFIEDVDETLSRQGLVGSGRSDVLEVLSVNGTLIDLEYRGRRIQLSNRPPRLESGFDPIPATLVVGAAWKMIAVTQMRRRLDRLGGLGVVACDLAFAARHVLLRRHERLAVDRSLIAASVGSVIVFDAIVALSRPRSTNQYGNQVFLTTSPTAALMVVLGTYAEQLDRLLWPVMAIGIAAWLVSSLVGQQRTSLGMLAEAVTLWEAFSSTRGLAANMSAEAQTLEASLQGDFQAQTRDARQRAVRAEMARYREQLGIVRDELDRLRSDLDDRTKEIIERECEEMAAWLANPATERELL